jgi:predicted AAA+ superfamily ATPase
MYIHRAIESAVHRLLPQRKAVLVTGARQVGKTTMPRHTIPEEFFYMTLDNYRVLQIAERDPMSFFSVYPLPTVVDEVRHAPSFFRQVKFVVDQPDAKGPIVLTGSQDNQPPYAWS